MPQVPALQATRGPLQATTELRTHSPAPFGLHPAPCKNNGNPEPERKGQDGASKQDGGAHSGRERFRRKKLTSVDGGAPNTPGQGPFEFPAWPPEFWTVFGELPGCRIRLPLRSRRKFFSTQTSAKSSAYRQTGMKLKSDATSVQQKRPNRGVELHKQSRDADAATHNLGTKP
jgi:hypothetical protein